MSGRAKLITVLIAAAVAMVLVGRSLRPVEHHGAFDLEAFGRIPVSAEGRVKPLDSVARNSLMMFSGRQTLRDDEGRQSPAIDWLVDVMARPELADNTPVFHIRHPNLRESIDPAAGPRQRFTFTQVMVHIDHLTQQAQTAQQTPAAQRDLYQNAVLELYASLDRYIGIQRLMFPYAVPPPPEEGGASGQWRQLAAALEAVHTQEQSDPQAVALIDILRAYRDQDAGAFNEQVHAYLASVESAMPGTDRKAGFEVAFNRIMPFYQGTILYVLVFLVAVASLLFAGSNESEPGRPRPRLLRSPWAVRLRLAAITLIVIAFAIHTFGLIGRMYLQDRWWVFVTNLYSSAVFIGWVVVLLGLILERLFRNGLGTLLASAVGFLTLIIAHNLAASGGGDTMQMMQAVLDSNFWLATHVTTVTIGYSAAFLAGQIGLAYILTGVYTRRLTPQLSKSLGKAMYGVIAFTLLFSFVGTVLGGIWADQSWGRFWGWDPKENGAVLIVLMMALILHARWGGMIQQRGMAVLAVGGNIITAWSWFGTNMLGVGLHSYGFMSSAYFWLLAYVASQLAIMAVGLMPMHHWASHRARSAKPMPPVDETPSPAPSAPAAQPQ